MNIFSQSNCFFLTWNWILPITFFFFFLRIFLKIRQFYHHNKHNEANITDAQTGHFKSCTQCFKPSLFANVNDIITAVLNWNPALRSEVSWQSACHMLCSRKWHHTSIRIDLIKVCHPGAKWLGPTCPAQSPEWENGIRQIGAYLQTVFLLGNAYQSIWTFLRSLSMIFDLFWVLSG